VKATEVPLEELAQRSEEEVRERLAGGRLIEGLQHMSPEYLHGIRRILTVSADTELVSAPAVFLQAARFQDHLYIGGPSGLLEFDLTGNPSRQFTAGRDMPPSPLVALAPTLLADSQEPELVLATAQDGLLAFNGHSFRQIHPQDSEARAITSILPASAGRLLIGTKKRGVLIYDGEHLAPLHPSLSSLYVTALAGTESDLWIGTLNQGVFHWHAGAVDSFSEDHGLPDRQVQCVTTAGE